MPSVLLHYPMLDKIYARASLLEVHLAAESLVSGVAVSDPAIASKGLAGKKASKYARAWGPLLVHNALHDKAFPDQIEHSRVFGTAESRLKDAAHSDWFAVMLEAANQDMAPIPYIRSLPKPRQSALLANRREWAGVGKGLEALISTWIIDHKPAICDYLSLESDPRGVSLKKLAKFKPRAD